MAMKERTGRNRVSKADQVIGKVSGDPVPSGRSRVSKADQVVRKIDTPVNPAPQASVRVRPTSKVDSIEKKIPVDPAPQASVRVRPTSKVDSIEKKIPVNPAPAAARPERPVTPPPSARVNPSVPETVSPRTKPSGCCLLPFVFGVVSIIGILAAVF